MIDSRKTLKIGEKLQTQAKISAYEQTNSRQERSSLSCNAVTQYQTLKWSIIVTWFDSRSWFWTPPSSTPMKPETRQEDIFVELLLQLKIALYGLKVLSITIDHYRQKKSLSLSVKISLSLIPGCTPGMVKDHKI